MRERFFEYHRKRFVRVNQQYPPSADPTLRKHRRKSRRQPVVEGLNKRYKPERKLKSLLPIRDHVPSNGYTHPPRPVETEWYHDEPAWYTDSGPRQLNVDYMCALADKHYSVEKASYMKQCYQTGFIDHYTGPPYTQALTPNSVHLGDPGSEEIGAQLLRVARRRKLWVSRWPVAGTKVLPANIVQKTKPNGTIKNRTTLGGNYPGGYDSALEAFSRKGHTPLADVAYSQQHTIEQLATYVNHPPSQAIISDLENAFESLEKHRYEINANCVRWDPGDAMWDELMEHVIWTGREPHEPGGPAFFYSGVHLFGLSGTPLHAHNSFGLLALEQLEIAQRYDPHASLSRRVDDTMVTVTSTVSAAALLRLSKELFAENEKSGHTLQHTKTEIGQRLARFDGFVFDFNPGCQRIGLPKDKGSTIRTMMEGFMNAHPRNRHDNKLHDREIAESLQGKLEHAATACPYLGKFLVAFRACWMPLDTDRALVTLSTEARADLQRICQLLRSQGDQIWCKFEHHFVQDPTVSFATDASGKPNKGFGGYVIPPNTPTQTQEFDFFCIDPKWRTFVDDTSCINAKGKSSGLLELLAVWAMLDMSTWKDTVLRWQTDSMVARDAWRKGRSESPLINRCIKRVAYTLSKMRCVLVVEHLSRETPTIVLADHLSRQWRRQFADGILPTLGRRVKTQDFRCPRDGLSAAISSLLSTTLT